MIKRLVLPLTGFLLGSTFIASFHIGILTTDTGISVDATLWTHRAVAITWKVP